MGYDERHHSNSSGAVVAVIGVGLVFAILAIIVVAAVDLFWVRGVSVQSQVVVHGAGVRYRGDRARLGCD